MHSMQRETPLCRFYGMQSHNHQISHRGPRHGGISVSPSTALTAGINKLEVIQIHCLLPEDTHNMTQLTVNQHGIEFFVDSGCRKTLLPLQLYQPTMGPLQPSQTKFCPYSTTSYLPIAGQLPATLQTHNGATHSTTIYVIDGHRTHMADAEDSDYDINSPPVPIQNRPTITSNPQYSQNTHHNTTTSQPQGPPPQPRTPRPPNTPKPRAPRVHHYPNKHLIVDLSLSREGRTHQPPTRYVP